jgi:hypothetical protein
MDYGAFMQASLDQIMAMSPRDAAQFESMLPLVGTFGDLGLGMTLLDGRSLAMDVSMTFDSEAMAAMMPAVAPFDPAFAEHLPSGTQLAIQGADPAAYFEQMMTSLTMLAEVQPGFDQGSPAEIMAGLEFAIQGVTGLDLQDDILSWMTGQYAIGMSIDLPILTEGSPSEDDVARAFQFAFVAENTTGEGAQALVTGLTTGLTQLSQASPGNEVTLSEETMGGAPALVISIESRGMRDPFQIVIGGNESVFVIGTPAMAQAALSPDGGLNSDPGYQDAAAVALDSAVQFLYGNGDLLNTLLEVSLFGRPVGDEASELAIGPLFSSASISATYTQDDVSARMVLTVAE